MRKTVIGTLVLLVALVDDLVEHKLPWLREHDVPVIVNIAGETVGEWTTYDRQGRVYKVTTRKPVADTGQ